MKIAAAILLVACLALVSLFVGVSDISPLALFGQGGDSQAAQIMLASRIPRTAAIMLAGVS
ncbi:hypothetical protein Q6311_29640, partial [Klebsiella variicola]